MAIKYSEKRPRANWDSLHRIFTIPEKPDSSLRQIEDEISQNLTGFLQENIVAKQKSLAELEVDFRAFHVPELPMYVSEQADFLLEKVVANSVHTASPTFIGHMTSALPYFMVSLSKILMALNQNLVKIETSKVFTSLEQQVLAMMHHLVFQKADDFYQAYMHHPDACLGVFCSGGSIANATALWIARNRAFPADSEFSGVANAGLYRALKYYQYEGAAILVSERGHYSLSKAADILGVGREDIHSIAVDADHKIQLPALIDKIKALQLCKIKIIAIVGVAGSSETGSIDPLEQLAQIARSCGAHFHVDAAWGGATLFSKQHCGLLKGVELADSVTIDAHKQLYVPMGAGMVLLKDVHAASAIVHHAQYIIRKGSRDLGRFSMEGSRSGMAMLVQSGLRIMGREGYAMLIDEGMKKAQAFAALIQSDPDFELITAPELNILTYRFVPKHIQIWSQQAKQRLSTENWSAEKKSPEGLLEQVSVLEEHLNELTRSIQKMQRERGKSFVSRTHIKRNLAFLSVPDATVFRVVLANPLTTMVMLEGILEEQRMIGQTTEAYQQVLGCEFICE